MDEVDIPQAPVVIVTGGTRGIGAAVARHAIRAGFRVLVTYSRDEDSAGAAMQRLTEQGGRAIALRAAAQAPETPRAVFERAEAELGPVTTLVNNAGVTGRIGPFTAASLEDMRRVLDVNILGTLLMCQEAIHRWQRIQRPGVIVNVSSAAATLGAPGEYVPYAASKAAVETMTVGIAKEVAADGIRVNAVAPGTIDTGIHAAAGEPGRSARMAGRIPMGRVGTADEIAEAVLWLTSNAASYVTGTVLRVAGGL